MAEIAFARLDELNQTWEDIENALEAAQQAQGAAEAAQIGAETAQGLAEDAQAAAEDAQDGAELAQTNAENAQGLAEAAQLAAETAQLGAETAESNAVIAQGAAEDARDDAIDARDFAYLWAQEAEDAPVDDGVHTGYSAYHWAEKAAASAGGTGAAFSVFGVAGGSSTTRADIGIGQDTVLGRDGSGNVDDIKIKVAHIHADAKTGSDAEVVTGTAGTNGNVASWNADGDLVDGGVEAADIYYAGGTDVAVADGGTGASDAGNARNNLGAAGLPQTGFISGVLRAGVNTTLRVIEYAPVDLTITGIWAKTASGTITLTSRINANNITGGAINVTSSQGSATPSADNVATAGSFVDIVLTSNSSAVNLSYVIAFEFDLEP